MNHRRIWFGVTECGGSLGGPPRKATLQTRPGKLVLYLPKRCLLDPKLTTKGPARTA